MSLYKPYQPRERLPYAVRLRNRIIVFTIFMGLCALLGTCIFGGSEEEPTPLKESAETSSPETSPKKEEAPQNQLLFAKADDQDIKNTQVSVTAAVAPLPPPEVQTIDSTHIKSQADVFLAEKIDNLLRRFKPEHAIVLMVDPKTNEIVAWGERRDNQVQSKPDYLVKNTFPAASLAKTITIAAAMESNRYSLNSQIPMIGASHTLYKNQLRVKQNFKGPYIELQDAYAKSSKDRKSVV